MSEISYLKSNLALGSYHPNMASLLKANQEQFPTQAAFGQRKQNHYEFWTWKQLSEDVLRFRSFLLSQNIQSGDRVGLISDRSYRRLVAELAVMAGAYVSVPIFKGYSGKMKSQLVDHADLSLLFYDDEVDISELPARALPALKYPLSSIDLNLFPAESIGPDPLLGLDSNHPAIILYTSGTTGFPKGVMISHKNILAQHKAHQVFWDLPPGIRVLSYLPWDHAFGSLFERFLTFYTGGCLCLDDSRGKDIPRLLDNFAKIKPDYFFSVPLVFERLQQYFLKTPELEKDFFHPGLRFIFTASAPLAPKTAEYFQSKQVPICEGWGLTETAPSVTLTQAARQRSQGHVGLPIPGVEIKIAPDQEVLVRGHNVMLGYFKNSKEKHNVIDDDGWLHTGDCGTLSPSGLRIHSRKDQIFKLSNGKKVNPRELENILKSHCPWIHHIYIFGKGEAYCRALIFSDPNEFNEPFSQIKGKIISALREFNQNREPALPMIGEMILLEKGLSLEKGELTPSLKIRGNILEKNYRPYLEQSNLSQSGLIANGVWAERLVQDL